MAKMTSTKIAVLAIIVIGIAGAVYWFKFRKPKGLAVAAPTAAGAKAATGKKKGWRARLGGIAKSAGGAAFKAGLSSVPGGSSAAGIAGI